MANVDGVRKALARLLARLALPLACTLLATPLACSSSDETASTNDGTGGSAGDPDAVAFPAPPTCAYKCPPSTCAESTTPYACENLGAWKDIPHRPSCGGWDGTYPTPAPGQCTATAPAGEALKYAGPDPEKPGVLVLPDGRRLHPAGAEWIFDETDYTGGLTVSIVRVPGTSFVLTVDAGPGDHAVRAIDTTKLGAGDPVVSRVKFADPDTLNNGVAFVPPDLVLVATNDGVVQALSFDPQTGALARDDARSIHLPDSSDAGGNPAPWYASGLAATADGARLVVTGVREKALLVYDVAEGSPTYGTLLGSVDLPHAETFAAAFDPNDAASRYAYVSLWDAHTVAEVDLVDPAHPAVARTFTTDKDPEGMAFLDGRWMVVASDLGDTIALVDRVAGTTTSVPVGDADLHGSEPSALAYDPATKRLYATLAGLNAVAAWDVDLSATPPKLSPAGRLGTSWWPSGVVAMPDGAIVVASMRGHGSGPLDAAWALGDNDIGARLRGGVQRIPAPSASDLAGGDQEVAANLGVGALAGYPKVSCPAGASDFPIPETNTEGPSSLIDHVFLIVRENKDFDGVLGDLPGVAGAPDRTLKASSEQMDAVWLNFRSLARTFALSDDYYTDAEFSTQGHVWTAHGRTNDFDERTWAISGNGRDARPIPGGGVIDVGKPVEGSLFDWLDRNGVEYDVLGEINGAPASSMGPNGHLAVDPKYPGGPIANISSPDLPKACYAAGRVRVLCDIGHFVYMTLPNDHTFGVGKDKATPETYVAVNDEATGAIVDAIAHSPYWQSSLVLITEDDPSQGGDHIDAHRAPLVVVSPWVKRGYVSNTHIDVASLHKLVAHVFGLPYPNVEVAAAGLPLDLFTSTPDFTPYTYQPRAWPLTCGGVSTRAEQELGQSWDFDEVDEQPGLDAQVTRWMRGKQFETLPPGVERRMQRRIERIPRPGERLTVRPTSVKASRPVLGECD